MVSKTVRTNLKKTEDYEIGETLVCRKYLKIGKTKFNVNYEYEIVKVFDNSVMIKDTAIRDETLACFTILKSVILNNFIHGYCRTCHSFQGSKIENKLIILDWKHVYVNRKWLYTAVTRATELHNIYL